MNQDIRSKVLIRWGLWLILIVGLVVVAIIYGMDWFGSLL